jgi:hypothetical protein
MRRSRGRSNSGTPSNHSRSPGYQEPLTPRRLPKAARITIVIAITVGITVGGIILGLEVFGSGGAAGQTSSEVGSEGQYTVDGSTRNVEANYKEAKTALMASGFSGSVYWSFDTNCASHSYGNVKTFFQSHPCKWLARTYIIIVAHKQNVALVAISWVDMPNLSLAIDYKNLVDVLGTGNITELSREVGPYRNVKFTGKYYISGKAGTAVWNVQVQPIVPTPVKVLKTILDDSRQ